MLVVQNEGLNSRTGAQTQALTERVNGVALPIVNLSASDNDPAFRSTWSTIRIDNVLSNTGTANSIELSTATWYVSIDEILVANTAQLAIGAPHRRVAGLPPGEQDALPGFLRELDCSAGGGPSPDGVFADGFEN